MNEPTELEKIDQVIRKLGSEPPCCLCSGTAGGLFIELCDFHLAREYDRLHAFHNLHYIEFEHLNRMSGSYGTVVREMIRRGLPVKDL